MALASPALSLFEPMAQENAITPSQKIGMTLRRFIPKEPYNWRGAQTHVLTTVVWYPTHFSAHEQAVEIPGLDIFELGTAAREASGRTVVYHSLTEEQMLEGARSHGMPESAVAYLAVLYGVVRAGHAAGITPYPETVAGKKPLSFESFAEQVDWN